MYGTIDAITTITTSTKEEQAEAKLSALVTGGDRTEEIRT